MKDEIKALKKRIAELEKQIAELKAQPKQEIHYHFTPNPMTVPNIQPTWPYMPTICGGQLTSQSVSVARGSAAGSWSVNETH